MSKHHRSVRRLMLLLRELARAQDVNVTRRLNQYEKELNHALDVGKIKDVERSIDRICSEILEKEK